MSADRVRSRCRASFPPVTGTMPYDLPRLLEVGGSFDVSLILGWLIARVMDRRPFLAQRS